MWETKEKAKTEDSRLPRTHMSENHPEWMSWGRDSLYSGRPEVSGTAVLWLPCAELPVESGFVWSGQQKAAGLTLSTSKEGRPEAGGESAACDGTRRLESEEAPRGSWNALLGDRRPAVEKGSVTGRAGRTVIAGM